MISSPTTVRRHPDRFFGLATLPFNSPEAMLKEFDRALPSPA